MWRSLGIDKFLNPVKLIGCQLCNTLQKQLSFVTILNAGKVQHIRIQIIQLLTSVVSKLVCVVCNLKSLRTKVLTKRDGTSTRMVSAGSRALLLLRLL